MVELQIKRADLIAAAERGLAESTKLNTRERHAVRDVARKTRRVGCNFMTFWPDGSRGPGCLLTQAGAYGHDIDIDWNFIDAYDNTLQTILGLPIRADTHAVLQVID